MLSAVPHQVDAGDPFLVIRERFDQLPTVDVSDGVCHCVAAGRRDTRPDVPAVVIAQRVARSDAEYIVSPRPMEPLPTGYVHHEA